MLHEISDVYLGVNFSYANAAMLHGFFEVGNVLVSGMYQTQQLPNTHTSTHANQLLKCLLLKIFRVTSVMCWVFNLFYFQINVI